MKKSILHLMLLGLGLCANIFAQNGSPSKLDAILAKFNGKYVFTKLVKSAKETRTYCAPKIIVDYSFKEKVLSIIRDDPADKTPFTIIDIGGVNEPEDCYTGEWGARNCYKAIYQPEFRQVGAFQSDGLLISAPAAGVFYKYPREYIRAMTADYQNLAYGFHERSDSFITLDSRECQYRRASN